uniref:Pumilio RNA-binding family member 3 n=2 Tax=Cyprinus carpio TaxID=7962 RepID=A0A8C1C031_CYPCA
TDKDQVEMEVHRNSTESHQMERFINQLINSLTGSEGKKPKWDEFKQKKKELKQNRQQNEKKESYLIVSRAKQVWEIVRRKGCDKRKRTKQMKELQRLVKEKLKQCKQQVGAVMSAFKGIVRQMLRHSEKLESIMDEMKQILTPVAQKEAVIKHSLIHKVFLDFFEHAPAKQRTEMIESIREAVVYMAHTHNGARVIMHCLWHGNPKDRKVIVKTMKSYIGKFAMVCWPSLSLYSCSRPLHMAEHRAGHLVLKWLMVQDATMKEAEREERFSRILLEKVGMENLKTWASVNRGAIVLCCLLQSADESVAVEVKVMLKSILPELKKAQNSKGVEVLLEKLADVCKYKTHKNNIYHYYYFSFYSHETNQEHVYTGYISPQKSMETFS